MAPTAPDSVFWTVIFVGSGGERSSMHITMTKEKLDDFMMELRPKVIDQPVAWNEIGDIHQFKPCDIFYVSGHLAKKEDIKNATP